MPAGSSIDEVRLLRELVSIPSPSGSEEEATRRVEEVARDAGLDVKSVTDDLQVEGVEKFEKSYADALKAIKDRSQSVGVG